MVFDSVSGGTLCGSLAVMVWLLMWRISRFGTTVGEYETKVYAMGYDRWDSCLVKPGSDGVSFRWILEKLRPVPVCLLT